MQKSGKIQKDLNEISNSSTSSHPYTSSTLEQSSGFVSMLSPRNLIKLFSKNSEEDCTSAPLNRNLNQYQSKYKTEQINREFEKYLQSLGKQMQKYKKGSSKNNKITQQELKKKINEEIQEQVKISKIPEQYFKEWDNSEINYAQIDQQVSQYIIDENINKELLETESHKSLRLRTLLIMGDGSKKKVKQKRKVLQQKQSQLQSYLDEIELIIFNKTSKYPDKYLNYLMNLKHSDLEVDEVIEKVNKVREALKKNKKITDQRYIKVLKLQKKKENLEILKVFITSVYDLYQFKEQSKKQTNKVQVQGFQKKISIQRVKYFLNNSDTAKLHRINCIKETFLNLQQMQTKIRVKKFQYICAFLKKSLSTTLNSMYSRDSWLKNDLPKDSLMINRMGIQIQPQIDSIEEGNMNNSYLNISILDQSYCVGGISTGKKENTSFGVEQFKKEQGKLSNDWKDYCSQYLSAGGKLVQQQQQVLQLVQRLTLKFIISFHQDIEDYICFIYNSKKVNLKCFSTHQERIIFLQPKIFNKISKVLFESLATVLNFALILKELPNVYKRVISIIEEQILKILESRKLSEYQLVEKNLITYEELNQIISSLDYWSQFTNEVSDKFQVYEEDEQGQMINQSITQFEESIQRIKQKILQSYVNNLHQCALTSQLKQAIQKQDFQSISIPLKYFSILNQIINYGQSKPSQLCANLGKLNDIQQSFSYPSSFVNELNSHEPKLPKAFSIFKIIDKKLIIQGKEYKICLSFLLLCSFIQIYIKTKIDFPTLSANIEQRICEVIGFYIWYCKKVVFTSNQTNNQQSKHTKSTYCNLNRKSILSLSMLNNICQLLSKFMDIFNLTCKPKKVGKVENDLKMIRQDCLKEIPMIPFLQIQKQISCLYESRLKTRKEIPTKQSMKIIEVLDQSRKDIQVYFQIGVAKRLMENSIKIVNKNYFGYLSNMQARGKQQLKWFFPTLKDTIGDIFVDQIANLEKYFKI